MKKNSLVWRFYDRIENSRGICTGVICKLCEIEYRFFGNTTNLRVHLSRKHPIQWELAHDDTTNNFAETNTTVVREEPPPSRRRKSKIILQEYDSDDATQSEGNTVLIKDMARPEEEWLDELYENIECKKKPIKVKRRIKKEVENDEEFTGSIICDTPDTETKDEYSAFGEYIATKLRKLRTPRTRGNIQQIITTVLWQAEYGAYDNADSVKNLFISFVPNITVVEEESSTPVDSLQAEMVQNEPDTDFTT